MTFEFQRKTLKREIEIEGVGIFYGKHAEVLLRPFDDGIVFSYQKKKWKAEVCQVQKHELRCTKLGEILVTEHLMSALNAMEVTDVLVEVYGEFGELPILGGGAFEYANAIHETGLQNTGKRRKFSLFNRVQMHDEDNPLSALHISVGEGKWQYVFHLNETSGNPQKFEAKITPEVFLKEIAPARTIAFESERESMLSRGIGLGANEENTLILSPNGYLNKNLFEDEPARHKLLDCLGDLYLTGVPCRFLNVSGERSGHKLNALAAKRLCELCEWEDDE